MEHPELAVRMTTSNELCDFAPAMPTSRSAPVAAVGKGWRSISLFESSFTPMASPECIAEVERKLGRKLEPGDIPHQHLINPSDDWWQQWFCDNGVPVDEVASAPRRHSPRQPGE